MHVAGGVTVADASSAAHRRCVILIHGTAADYRRPRLDRLSFTLKKTQESCVRRARTREWRSTLNKQLNWWETFFEGVAVDMWLQAVPPEHSLREADRLEKLLGASPGAEILDVPCGGGRLTLTFSARGYRMTGVDWSSQFLDHARSIHGADKVAWEQRDMRDLPWQERFDAAFCVGNSFGYLDDDGNAAFLRSVRAALKPGGRF